jgi:hypothetical protein
MTYNVVKMVQQAGHERRGPNGVQIVAYTAGSDIAGTTYPTYTWFEWRWARSATVKNLQPLKPFSLDTSTILVKQEPGKHCRGRKIGHNVRVPGI